MHGTMIDLEILRAGPPEGIAVRPNPLVFLHGAFAGAWCWAEHFLAYFAMRGYRVYAPSFRGHGGSGGRRDLNRFGISDYVADLASVIEDLDDPPVLIGNSMGGFVAMKYAEQNELAGLVLMASVPPAGLSGPSMSLAVWNPVLMAQIGMVQAGRPDAMTSEGFETALFSKNLPREMLHKYAPMMGGESTLAVSEMHGMVQVHPHRIKGRMPIQVLGGSEDGLIPAAYVRSTGRLLGVNADIVSGVGHGMMLDVKWEKVAARVAGWLERNDI